jgi:RNA polymerase sigma-70 factor (sigma-E family)
MGLDVVMADFDSFVREHAASFERTAWLMCHDVEDARDLVQTALTKTYARWPRLDDRNLRGYVVVAMANEFRRGLRRRERRAAAEAGAAGTVVTEDGTGRADDREVALRLLDSLGPRQRAVVVLRIVEDLPEREVARLMRCSVGTVKSQTARALHALRARAAATLEGER